TGIDRVVIATDDDRIAEASRSFGADVIMTSSNCANGTERCADALPVLGDVSLVVNLQGDAPLIPPWFVEDLVTAMLSDPQIQVATPVLRCDQTAVDGFRADRRAGRVGGTTAVFDRTGRALYFSKEVLPYVSQPYGDDDCPVFHHVGVYAYRPKALNAYMSMTPGRLETEEGLEQLRFLEHGHPVHCVQVASRGARFWELNNPEDTPLIEEVLSERGTV
ncbi:MAG: manno-octulosonate cytidylyltransferase, partial [Pseudomonadota bacterium]